MTSKLAFNTVFPLPRFRPNNSSSSSFSLSSPLRSLIQIYALLCLLFFIEASSASSPSSSSTSPSSTGHLVVLTPKYLRASQPENILLIHRRNDTSIISDDTQSIIVQIHDSSSLLFERTLDFLAPNVPHLVPISVSSSPEEANGNNGLVRSVILSVILTEGSEASKQVLRRELKILPATGFAFIQTDKPIYSPRDVLKIRLLKLDDSLKPAKQEQLKLRIKVSQKSFLIYFSPFSHQLFGIFAYRTPNR